jgi:hypothetical protein
MLHVSLEQAIMQRIAGHPNVARCHMQAGVSEVSIGGTSREILEQMKECAAEGEAGLGAFLLP